MIGDDKKNSLARSVCDKYISINSNNCIDFKGLIKHNINVGIISDVEAMHIVLNLIYDIVNSKLTRFYEIKMYASSLVSKVEKFHDKSNNDYTNLNDIFTHDYSFERRYIKKYLFKEYGNSGIDFSFIDCNLYDEISQEQSDVKTSPNKKSNLNLNHLSRRDLCYILDLNPELTFDKDKVLKKQLINEYQKVSDDVSELENLYSIQIRNSLKPVIEKRRKKEKFNALLSKVKSFNKRKLSDILNSSDEYLKIYDEISIDFKDCDNESIKYFVGIHDFTQNLDRLCEIKNQLESFDTSIQDLEEKFINFEDRLSIKSSLNDFSSIDEFPEALKIKLLDENPSLKEYIKLSKDLDNYSYISDSDEDNKVRLHNENVLDEEISKNKEFFQDITDVNKKRAIVLDEKNVRVIAGAGTGKTFTLQKKVKYLVEHKGILPEKILCLCYTNKGADDLNEKVNADFDEDLIEVCTFHEFCRRVDRYCGYNKKTNRYLLDNTVRNYIKYVVNQPEKMNRLTEYFGYYINRPIDNNKFSNYNELLRYETADDLSTLKDIFYKVNHTSTFQGENVRSVGELIIANYLFMHNIKYDYEDYYGHCFADLIQKRFLYSGKYLSLPKISNKYTNKSIVKDLISDELKWQRHTPDFYLPDYDIYLEHFGIGKYNNEKWLHRDYLKQMDDKRNRHKLYGTKLIETYYYYLAEGRLIEELESLLKDNGVEIGQRNQQELMDILTTTNKIDDFKDFNELVKTFINIFEAQYYPKTMFDTFKDRNKNEKNGYKRNRQDLFFDIVKDIYDIYYSRNQEDIIDHNREITNALELIQNGEYNKSYDYILIDEYQDINYVRCRLLQELQNKFDCKIFVVGDDWQSIYKFNGSDVNLFIDFDEYFPHSEMIKLEENRRNCQKLNDIASRFILENDNQEFKKLRYYIDENNPNDNPVKIVSYEKEIYYKDTKKNKILKLDAIIQDILKNNDRKGLRILLLGRNNADLNDYVGNSLFKHKNDGKYKKILYSKNMDLDITFMTVHQSKGLEYDEVVLLRVENDEYGFPNMVEDDSILSFVKNYEKYPYAEERRLFYVALTRTLNNIYLLTPSLNESVFIDDLIENYDVKKLRLPVDDSINVYEESDFFKEFEYIETDIKCPNCENGKVTLVINNKRGTKYFRCSRHAVPNPTHFDGGPYNGKIEDLKYVEKCPSCKGILVRQGNMLKCCLNKAEGCMETKELKLDEKDLDYND